MRRGPPVVCIFFGVAALVAPAIGALTGSMPVLAQAAVREAPFGDKAGSLAVNYTRLKPHIAGAEKQAVEAAGLRYVNIPVTGGVPTDAQIAEFARVVEDANNAPLLVHCASANRVGAMWTLYRVRQGVPLSIALEGGRTAGLRPDNEAELRKRL
ncbi:MAG: sulfur transferase domain-containing protein [Rhodoplanes sp.]